MSDEHIGEKGIKRVRKEIRGLVVLLFTNSFMEITAARKLARSGQGEHYTAVL